MDIKLENLPSSISRLTLTNAANTYSGSYSKGKIAFANAMCYRIWMSKDAESGEKSINVCCWIKEAEKDIYTERVDYAEEKFDFTDEGLKAAEDFIKARIEAESRYFE